MERSCCSATSCQIATLPRTQLQPRVGHTTVAACITRIWLLMNELLVEMESSTAWGFQLPYAGIFEDAMGVYLGTLGSRPILRLELGISSMTGQGGNKYATSGLKLLCFEPGFKAGKLGLSPVTGHRFCPEILLRHCLTKHSVADVAEMFAGYLDCMEKAIKYLVEVEQYPDCHPAVVGLRNHLAEHRTRWVTATLHSTVDPVTELSNTFDLLQWRPFYTSHLTFDYQYVLNS